MYKLLLRISAYIKLCPNRNLFTNNAASVSSNLRKDLKSSPFDPTTHVIPGRASDLLTFFNEHLDRDLRS